MTGDVVCDVDAGDHQQPGVGYETLTGLFNRLACLCDILTGLIHYICVHKYTDYWVSKKRY